MTQLAQLEHPLFTQLRERIGMGLKRATITRCAKWSETYRIMGQPFPGAWKFDHHPWLREMHDCDSEIMVGMKSAQMGYTETGLNKSFFGIDVKRISVLYVLPASTPDASDFSTSRFDPALELSPHLSKLFSDVKNIGHKRAGSANFFLRGSRSRSQMKSLPVALIIFDEVDEMVQENITLAFERVSGQSEHQIFLLSTPTIEKYGIHKFHLVSTQETYTFRCPHCGRYTSLEFPECLVITGDTVTDPKIIDSYIICKECKVKLDHAAKIEFLKNKFSGGSGVWVPAFRDRASRSFSINQLYSMTVHPHDFAISYLNSQNNPTDEQEFYNSKVGSTHTVSGAKISDDDIDNVTHAHHMSKISSSDILAPETVCVEPTFEL